MDLSPYLARLGFRAKAFQTLFGLLQARLNANGPLTIVETGCIRQRDAWEGDGNSSILFDHFAGETGSRFYTIDIDPEHCRLATETCRHGTVLCGDSVRTLYGLRKHLNRMDSLYLDSFDVDWNSPHPSALHHLKELCAAMPLFQPGSLVFVDDNVDGVGKGMYVREFMEAVGASMVCDDYIIGFVWP